MSLIVTNINNYSQLKELNLESVQNGLLDQIKVVYLNQIFPIWVESEMCVFVKTSKFKIDF